MRSAFRHNARYYLEVARTPAIRAEDLDERLDVETPEVVDGGVRVRRPDRSSSASTSAPSSCPALFLAAGRAAPSRRWRPSTTPRSRAGSSAPAGRSGSASSACARPAASCSPRSVPGTPVGLVGDRDLTGGGMPVRAVRRPGRAPARPGDARRRERRAGLRRRRPADRLGRYIGRLEAVRVPAEGTRRERVEGDDDALAAAFERIIEDAPGAVVGRLLPDLAGPRGGRVSRDRGSEPPTAADRAGPTCTSTRSPRTGPRAVTEILDHVAGGGDLDVIAITDHERIDAARRRPGDGAGPRPAARGHRRRGGHDPRRPPAGAASSSAPVRSYRSLRATIAAVHEPGGIAIPAHPLVPYPLCAQGFALRRLLEDPDPRVPPRRDRDVQPDGARPAAAPTVVRFADEYGLAARRQQRRPRPRRHRARLDHVPGPHGRGPAGGARGGHAPSITARSTAPPASSGRSGEQLRKRRRDARDELIGRLRRDGTGRDHGYPGGRARPPRFDADRR